MESKKGGSQFRDALLAAGLKRAESDAQSVTAEGKPLIEDSHLVIRDLPASGSQETPAVEPGRISVPPSRNPCRAGAGPVKSTGQATERHVLPSSDMPSAGRPATDAPDEPQQPSPPRLVKRGSFRPHPLLDLREDGGTSLLALEGVGYERQAPKEPSDATEFVIGLDFGTSTTKVVLRDIYRELALPVRFGADATGIDEYLLPSNVYRTGASWSLTDGHTRIRDLKLRLLHASGYEPIEEFNDCCAYLALVIRRCRAWLFSEHGKEYSKHHIEWRLNLGIAARSYEDRRTVSRFRRLAWAAANISAQPTAEISLEMVNNFRLRSRGAIERNMRSDDEKFLPDQIDVVPEISAQLQGFMRAARWDWANRPLMMLIDIGAGTVDAALFSVTLPSADSPTLNVFSNRVEQNGVINLHRARIDWLDRAARTGEAEKAVLDYLAAQRVPTDRLRPIPESVSEYVPGYSIECTGMDADGIFLKEKYRLQVAGCIHDARVGKGLKSHHLERMPLLLCGGGSRMRYFSQITEIINATPTWTFEVEKLSMPVPAELADFGMNSTEFDRISVAYGLSQVGNGHEAIGKVVRATEVPPMRRGDASADRELPKNISKDQV